MDLFRVDAGFARNIAAGVKMSEDRRRFTRVSFDSSCFLSDGEAEYGAQLLDISLKGALIRVEKSSIYESDKMCDLRIVLNGSTIEMNVRVKMVHRNDNRIGLYFKTIDIDSLTHLRKLIELNVGDAERTLQELFLWSTPTP
jgi:hypothetical protein